ncbi:UNVERIFIED_CONTAM: hypothetical protein Sradi_3852400 [Sesamum radiatum]|uniref:Zinc finger PMZ-type domain-containing protein n=1 Tax=Sesamum radiatum TaxID=300843 RepID=A0AAW2Q1L6_SESRA
MFQLVGYPCCHAIAAISYHRLNLEDYVEDYFKKEAYLRVYRHMINHVPGMHDYEESSLGIVNPPHVATKVGRPKKVRRRDANDLKDGNVVSRKGLSHTCANCLKTATTKGVVQIQLIQIPEKHRFQLVTLQKQGMNHNIHKLKRFFNFQRILHQHMSHGFPNHFIRRFIKTMYPTTQSSSCSTSCQ